ncbi:hypothetical protein DFJ77DRAFT_455037 [Powellomyces hirtus]|nr:hypothetical protein DFJ77DRAFT_455037 [Powellomyces hirtus]
MSTRKTQAKTEAQQELKKQSGTANPDIPVPSAKSSTKHAVRAEQTAAAAEQIATAVAADSKAKPKGSSPSPLKRQRTKAIFGQDTEESDGMEISAPPPRPPTPKEPEIEVVGSQPMEMDAEARKRKYMQDVNAKLLEAFNVEANPTQAQMEKMAMKLNMTVRHVFDWFANMRAVTIAKFREEKARGGKGPVPTVDKWHDEKAAAGEAAHVPRRPSVMEPRMEYTEEVPLTSRRASTMGDRRPSFVLPVRRPSIVMIDPYTRRPSMVLNPVMPAPMMAYSASGSPMPQYMAPPMYFSATATQSEPPLGKRSSTAGPGTPGSNPSGSNQHYFQPPVMYVPQYYVPVSYTTQLPQPIPSSSRKSFSGGHPPSRSASQTFSAAHFPPSSNHAGHEPDSGSRSSRDHAYHQPRSSDAPVASSGFDASVFHQSKSSSSSADAQRRRTSSAGGSRRPSKAHDQH